MIKDKTCNPNHRVALSVNKQRIREDPTYVVFLRFTDYLILKYILMDFTIVIKISYNYDLLIWISLRRRSAILIGMTELI